MWFILGLANLPSSGSPRAASPCKWWPALTNPPPPIGELFKLPRPATPASFLMLATDVNPPTAPLPDDDDEDDAAIAATAAAVDTAAAAAAAAGDCTDAEAAAIDIGVATDGECTGDMMDEWLDDAAAVTASISRLMASIRWAALVMLLDDGGVEPELESGVCSDALDDGGPPAPVGVPAIESGSSLKEGTCEWGDGVAAADESIDGGVPTELAAFVLLLLADGLLEFVVVVAVGLVVVPVALLGLMVGDEVEDNGPPATADAGLWLLVGSDSGAAVGVVLLLLLLLLLVLLLREGLWDVTALVTGTVVATELVAATTATDDSPEMAVAAVVVLANGGDRGEWLAEWLPSRCCGDGLLAEVVLVGDLRFGTE